MKKQTAAKDTISSSHVQYSSVSKYDLHKESEAGTEQGRLAILQR